MIVFQAIEVKQSAAAAGTNITWAESMKAGYAEAMLAGDVRQPPLIYSSRTHSQLAQVMRELKRTSYRCGAAILARLLLRMANRVPRALDLRPGEGFLGGWGHHYCHVIIVPIL